MESKIKAGELRVGNWVKTMDGINQIDGIGEYVLIDKYAESFDSLSGVELSEQVLLKCGFEKTKSGYYNNGKGNNLFVDFENKYLRMGVGTSGLDCMFYIVSVNIKHLHQLQNLYFALTGKEIEFKA